MPTPSAQKTPASVTDGMRSLERDTRAVLSAIEQLSSDASAALREQMDERPLAALGAAFVAGYVLGGGFSFRLATLLAGAAGRATLANLVARGASNAWAGGRS